MRNAELHDLVRLHLGQLVAFKLDGTALSALQAGDRPKNRGLARAVGANQSDDFALVQMEGDPLHGLDRPVGNVKVFHVKHRHFCTLLPDRLR
ncbi:hypothetical protein SDC9_153643 [bioreactor metagenome]|uniref:Uncharacterized protein n=1 Tax=bioreactor metagenome TaxID=1076179 RepID=A0A645EWX6_9ZZZZ